MNEKQVAELFVEQHVLQPSQAEDVLNEANQNGKSIVQAMVDGDEHREEKQVDPLLDQHGTAVDMIEKIQIEEEP